MSGRAVSRWAIYDHPRDLTIKTAPSPRLSDDPHPPGMA